MRRMLCVLVAATALAAALPSLAAAMHGPGDDVAPPQPTQARAGHATAYLPIAAGVAGGIVVLVGGALFVVGFRRDRRASHPPALSGQSR